MYKYLLAVLVLVLSFSIFYFVQQNSEKRESINDKMEAIIEKLNEDMREKDLQIKKLGHELTNLKQSACRNDSHGISLSRENNDNLKSDVQDNAAELSPEEQIEVEHEKAVKKTAQMAEKINIALRNDSRTSQWGKESEDRIVQGFNNYGIEGSNVRELECSDSICRIEVQHGKVGNLVNFVERAVSSPPIEISSVFIPEPPDGIDSDVTIVYYSKKDTANLFTR